MCVLCWEEAWRRRRKKERQDGQAVWPCRNGPERRGESALYLDGCGGACGAAAADDDEAARPSARLARRRRRAKHVCVCVERERDGPFGVRRPQPPELRMTSVHVRGGARGEQRENAAIWNGPAVGVEASRSDST